MMNLHMGVAMNLMSRDEQPVLPTPWAERIDSLARIRKHGVSRARILLVSNLNEDCLLGRMERMKRSMREFRRARRLPRS